MEGVAVHGKSEVSVKGSESVPPNEYLAFDTLWRSAKSKNRKKMASEQVEDLLHFVRRMIDLVPCGERDYWRQLRREGSYMFSGYLTLYGSLIRKF